MHLGHPPPNPSPAVFFKGLPPLQGQPTLTWNVSTSNWNHRKNNSQNKKNIIPKIFRHPTKFWVSRNFPAERFQDLTHSTFVFLELHQPLLEVTPSDPLGPVDTKTGSTELMGEIMGLMGEIMGLMGEIMGPFPRWMMMLKSLGFFAGVVKVQRPKFTIASWEKTHQYVPRGNWTNGHWKCVLDNGKKGTLNNKVCKCFWVSFYLRSIPHITMLYRD